MFTILLTVLLIISLVLSFLLFLSYRNVKVYKFRTIILRNYFETYLKLPSYNAMMFYFWIPLKLSYWTNFKYPEVKNFVSSIYYYLKYRILKEDTQQ